MKPFVFLLLFFHALRGFADSGCDAAATAPEDLLRIDDKPAAQLRFIPHQIRVGEPFELEIQLCDPAMVLKAVDATMPSHGHGMNYQPRVSMAGLGLVRAGGFLFHMPGDWEITLDIQHGDVTSRLVREYTLEP